MKNLDKIAEELFNKIRGRYPSITLGDKESTITNVPGTARFFDFDFREGVKVNVTLDENSITILYNNDLIEESPDTVKSMWFDFMKEMRTFAKKRMLNFDTRDITKSNLDKRDYQYLSQNRPGEEQMSESKMYGTSKTSFQDIGNAKMIVKHRGPVDFENPAGRTQQIDSIYIESAEGERFKYPFRHLNGARAMCTHVSEGGNQYDAFGKHIVSLSEELSKLRTFKTYMNRSAVMAEGLAGYMDIVNTRIETIKETVFKLQRPTNYKEAFESFEETVLEEVPEDVSSNWIDELTIRQFNEDLKSVFPYIYNLVKENTKAKQIGPDDLLGEFDGPDETETQDDDKKEKLEAWYNKFNKYKGNNGDDLADGFFEAYLDTGILTDATETNEFAKAVDDVFGGDRNKAEEELFGNEDSMKKHLPITYAMHNEFEKIMGLPVGATSPEDMEDNVTKAAKILGDEVVGFSLEGMDMNDNYASHLDSVVATSKHEQGPVQEEDDEGKDRDSVRPEMVKKVAEKIKAEYVDELKTYNDRREEVVQQLKSAGITDPREIEKEIQDMDDDILGYYSPSDIKGKIEVMDSVLELGPDADGHEIVDLVHNSGMDTSPREEIADQFQDELKKADPETFKKLYGNKTTVSDIESTQNEGNEFAQKVRELKAKGAKPGTKFKTSDGEEHTLEDAIRLAGLQVEDFWSAEELMAEKGADDTMDVKIDKDGAISKADAPDELHDKKEELPLDEFIKGHFDYTTNQFPKGETAVMTAVEKKYGDEAMKDAMNIMKELVTNQDEEMARIKTLAGVSY